VGGKRKRCLYIHRERAKREDVIFYSTCTVTSCVLSLSTSLSLCLPFSLSLSLSLSRSLARSCSCSMAGALIHAEPLLSDLFARTKTAPNSDGDACEGEGTTRPGGTSANGSIPTNRNADEAAEYNFQSLEGGEGENEDMSAGTLLGGRRKERDGRLHGGWVKGKTDFDTLAAAFSHYTWKVCVGRFNVCLCLCVYVCLF